MLSTVWDIINLSKHYGHGQINFAIHSHDNVWTASRTGLVIGILYLLWLPYVIGHTIIFLPCGFYLSSFFPHLISAVGDWMSTIRCGLSANLECMSEMCCTRLSRLGSVTARHSSSGRQLKTLRHWTEGTTYIWQGDHHIGHLPTFLVLWDLCAISFV